MVCVMCCVSQPLQSLPSAGAHGAGCVLPSGSNARSMPVECNSAREEKIVSFVPAAVTRPGGGLRFGGGPKVLALPQLIKGVMWIYITY